jgi:FkbM family methyltransferase
MELRVRNLRPAKVRNALRRRWFERQVPRLQMDATPNGIVELGSSYGGWMIPDGVVEPSWICYCVGAGGDISFDLELIERYGATVRAFDAVESYVRSAERDGAGNERFSAHHAAIATSDGPIRMQVTHDTGSSSVSAAELYESHEYVELPGRTLPSLMAELGDTRIDLLKLDIEGAEYGLLPELDVRALGVKVFATQLHHTGSVAQARALIAGLRDQGYAPVACRSAVKITFLARDAGAS